MYQFGSGLVGGLIGICAFGLIQETGSIPRESLHHSVIIGVSVNRAAKGDRLQSEAMRSSDGWKSEFNARIKGQVGNDRATNPAIKLEKFRAPSEMPVGCEPAVSIVLDDVLAKIPSRCISRLSSNEILHG